jgi:hypothetical protein
MYSLEYCLEPNFEPSLWYVVTQEFININTKIIHYETRLLHPWDVFINYTYNMSSAIKLQSFVNYTNAIHYANELSQLTYEMSQLQNLLVSYKKRFNNF